MSALENIRWRIASYKGSSVSDQIENLTYNKVVNALEKKKVHVI